MRRLALLAVLTAGLVAAPAALAHPLGNFTTNRYSELDVSGDRVYVLYVLDLAEIPTFQERGKLRRAGKMAYGRRLASEVGARLRLTADGQRLALRPLRHTLAFPPGVGKLKTTRLEALFSAALPERAVVDLAYRDATFPGRIGWKEVVVRGRDGARIVSSTAPPRSASARLRAYPNRLLDSPRDVRETRARVETGESSGAPPALSSRSALEAPARVDSESENGFAELITQDDLSLGVVLVALVVALFWGAAHALTPGHGKAIVAAYLVGTRGKARHAFLLGGIVTVTHTIGVFALGLVTLALSEFIVPEQLYPWLNLVSALLVVGVGLAVLRARFRRARHDHPHDHHHGHEHHHPHHHHDHDYGERPAQGLRGLVAVGVSGGLLPCPTALVVLLAAISLHRVGYGLLLIVAFSVGLASVVTAIGLVAVTAKRAFARMQRDGPLVRALPAVSALVVLGLGVAMTARAVPQLI
jgi:nickel/cobalt transporter (NicO) family protein